MQPIQPAFPKEEESDFSLFICLRPLGRKVRELTTEGVVMN